ncbi:MAG TPA: glutamyl-tRNA reductase [Verrucomicrobiae bacterium]|nr:glutamyl-tRNA reductase [Verrucomicrobiae bacterium]
MLYLVGLNHKSAPVDVRERLHFPKQELGAALPQLLKMPSMREAIILSTCNRIEVIASAGGVDEAGQAIRSFIGSRRPEDVLALDNHAYRLVDLDAARHVFRVASSLDSMIVGEPQILGQVKEAYALAVEAGTVGPALSSLMQRAFSCAKRVRTETQIAKNPVSIAYAAAELAAKIFGSLEGRTIMILGAGEMSELAARHLMKQGVKGVFVANRTYHKAVELAREFQGVAINFDRYLEHLPKVDIVISSTAAPHYVLRAEDGPAIMKSRRHRPLFVVDIAVPRDVDPRLNDLDNLYLYNIDDLQTVVDTGLAERMREAAIAESMIDEEVLGYAAWLRSVEVKPTIVDLRRHFGEIAAAELKRHRAKLGDLDPKQEHVVEEIVSSVVNKLLHHPTVELKHALESRDGHDLVKITRQLFELGEPAPEMHGSGPAAAPPASPEDEA